MDERMMDIGGAVHCLRDGRRVARAGWHDQGVYLQAEPASAAMRRPMFVYLCTANGEIVPWTCSQSDLLATDWVVLEA